MPAPRLPPAPAPPRSARAAPTAGDARARTRFTRRDRLALPGADRLRRSPLPDRGRSRAGLSQRRRVADRAARRRGHGRAARGTAARARRHGHRDHRRRGSRRPPRPATTAPTRPRPRPKLDLSIKTASSDPVRLYFREMGKVPLLTAVEEVSLAKRIERHDMAAKRKLIEANLRLVVSIAKRLRRPRAAAARPHPGGQPRAHARRREVRLPARLQVQHLRHLVDPPGHHPRARRPGAHHPRPGAHGREHQQAHPRAAAALQELGREPTPEEIAAEMGVTPDKVREIQKISQEPVSLENPVGDDGDSQLGDFIEDEQSVVAERRRSASIMQARGDRPRARAAHASASGTCSSCASASRTAARTRSRRSASQFGVTRERIRQIEAKTLAKLKAYREAQCLQELPRLTRRWGASSARRRGGSPPGSRPFGRPRPCGAQYVWYAVPPLELEPPIRRRGIDAWCPSLSRPAKAPGSWRPSASSACCRCRRRAPAVRATRPGRA